MIAGGQALLVEIKEAGALPKVTPFTTGCYTWISFSEQINSRQNIDFLANKLRGTANDLDRILVHLAAEGALSLEDRRYFEEQIVDGVSAAFCFMRIDGRRLFPRPTTQYLDQIDRGGFVRAAAEVLKRKADEGDGTERDLAAEALQRLYIEHMKLRSGSR